MSHRHPVRLDENVSAKPRLHVDVLHTRGVVEPFAFGVDRTRDVGIGNRRVITSQDLLLLGFGVDVRVAHETGLQVGGAALQEALALDALRDRLGNGTQTRPHGLRQRLDRLQRQRFPVDRVAGEELVGALPAQDHRDVLGGFLRHEVQRHQGRVGDRIVQVPHDLGQGRHHLGGTDLRADGLDAQMLGRLQRDVELVVVPGHVESHGETQDVGVELARESDYAGGVDTA